MSLDITNIPIDSGFNVTIPNTLLAQDPPSDKLLVLLPGRGYLNEHPLMHYLMNVALAQNYDVLMVSYGFQIGHLTFFPDQLSMVVRESAHAIEAALSKKMYSSLCIAGKSLGTMLAGQLITQFDVGQKSLILLTPVQNSHAQTETIPTLAVIGTADAAYAMNDMTPRDNVTWRTFDGLNHSLEDPEDWRRSISVLAEIMTACDEFLGRDKENKQVD